MSAWREERLDNECPPRLGWGMWKRFLIAGVLIVLLSGAATATFALNTISTIAGEVFPRLNQIHTRKGVIVPIYSGGPKTFLIIGSDRRARSKDAYDRNNPPHSDTLLLVHLDPEAGQTSIMSIPRDLLSTITTRGGGSYYPRKINAAYTIGSLQHGTDGGAELVAETIERLLHIKLNGVIDVTFKGFIDVVDTLGCVYVNVDHRYLHHSEATESQNYSSINLEPGYQKLCYEDALSYVRYRHGDSDFVRVARQQDFLRDLRQQIPVGNLIGEMDKVSKAVGKAVTSTFKSSASELIQLAKLVVFSQQKPMRQVKFAVDSANTMIGGESYVTASAPLIASTVRDFLHGHEQLRLSSARPSSPSRRGAGRSSSGPSAPDMYPVSASGKAMALNAAPELPFPLEYPALQTGPAIPQEVHPYTLRDQHGHRHHAYVAVWQQTGLGGYYDVEGTDWSSIPLFAKARTQQLFGRTYMIVDDGSHIHDIGWHEGKDVYFVSNTLLEDLSNAQMIAIARSTRPLQ
jgi:polyisoprenyl-teichoic acid--peptidoglycan teichoic acid transferase